MISIIIPTYNWSSALRLAIKSVLWQTYQDFEILVIGDCCTDDSEAVVASFKDPRIKWHNLPENSGSQSIPNNKGIELARGEWVAHLGHDDIWHPAHLEHLVAASKDADFIYSMSVSLGPNNEETEHKNKVVLFGINPHKNKDNIILPPSSIMYKKKVWKAVGPWKHYKELEISPDHDFERRAYAYCKGRIAPSKELTCFKFPSSWRKNSYIEKPIHQQLECIRGIEKNPYYRSEILARLIHRYIKDTQLEWMKTAALPTLYWTINNYWAKNPERAQLIIDKKRPKGEGILKARIYRGLESTN